MKILETISDYNAWDIPNSNMIVTLKKFTGCDASNVNKKQESYVAGVSFKSKSASETGFSFFNVKSDIPMTAFEKILFLIDKSAEISFRAIELCDEKECISIHVYSFNDINKFPRVNEPFIENLFSIFPYIIEQTKRDAKLLDIAFVRREYENRTVLNSCCLTLNGKILFMGKPSFDKKEAMENLKMTAIGAAVMLEKFQESSWEVLVDSTEPDYKIGKCLGNGCCEMIKLK